MYVFVINDNVCMFVMLSKHQNGRKEAFQQTKDFLQQTTKRIFIKKVLKKNFAN